MSSAAAVSKDTASGMGMSDAEGTTTNSLYPPPCTIAATRALIGGPPAPFDATTPAISVPSLWGNATGTGYVPRR